MGKKIKATVCMICVYVVSFMTTVTAFAEGFIIANPNFVGKYTDAAGIIPGYILVDQVDGSVKIFAYEDDKELCFYTGRSEDAKLSNSPYNFYARFETVARVTIDGSPAYDTSPRYDYKATGDIKLTYGFLWSIKKVTIVSNESAHSYEHIP